MINIYNPNLTIEDLKAMRLRMAKTANQRMRVLEHSGHTRYAYSRPKAYLKRIGRKRFSEVLDPKGYTEQQLRVEVGELAGFLNAQTSTITGIKKYRKNLLNTFRAKGITISDEFDIIDFFESEQYKSALEHFSSDILVELYDDLIGSGYTKEDILSGLEKYLEGDNDETLNDLYSSFALDFFDFI